MHMSELTVDDGTTIDLIGPGSTPLHYGACGGNAVCCQMLIAKGASLTAQNANGSIMAQELAGRNPEPTDRNPSSLSLSLSLPSPFLSLPLMSIMTISRELGWRNRRDVQSVQKVNFEKSPCIIPKSQKTSIIAKKTLYSLKYRQKNDYHHVTPLVNSCQSL